MTPNPALKMLVKSTSQRFLLGKPQYDLSNLQHPATGKREKMSFYCFQPQIYYCTNLLHCLEEARTVCVSKVSGVKVAPREHQKFQKKRIPAM